MIWGRSGKVQASQTEEARDTIELSVRSPGGFSEEALKGLADLEARMPPPEAVTEPAFTQVLPHDGPAEARCRGGRRAGDRNGQDRTAALLGSS